MYKEIIKIPKNIKIIEKDNTIYLEGPLSTIDLNNFLKNIKINNSTKEILVFNKNKAKQGLFVSILKNKIKGINQGFKIYLHLNGIGFKAILEDKNICFKLGYSHDIILKIPDNIKVVINKSTIIILFSTDWEKLTRFASDIRRLKKIDPYKNKGILFKNEKVLKKEGKKK